MERAPAATADELDVVRLCNDGSSHAEVTIPLVRGPSARHHLAPVGRACTAAAD